MPSGMDIQVYALLFSKNFICCKTVAFLYDSLLFPQKNNATVPGPVWLPIVVPI